MSNDYTNPAFKKLLKKLQEESWQLELIISGFAIYGLITAYPFLIVASKEANNDGNNLLHIVILVALVSCSILIINLLLHVLLRGLWIGALGLRYVSGDIDYEILNYSEKFTKYLKNKVGSFDKYIATLENYCSIIFAVSFLLIFYVLAFTFTIACIAVIINVFLENDGLGNSFGPFIGVPLLVFIILGMFITFIDFVTQGWLKKKKWISKIYFPIYWIFSFITLSFLYRPLVYNFLDNKFGKRLSLLLVPLFMILLLATSFSYKKSNYFQFDELSGSRIANSNNYEDLLVDNDDFIQNVAISSKVITEPFVKIFILFDEGIEDDIYDFNDSLRPKNDHRGLVSQIQFSNDNSWRERLNLRGRYMDTFNDIYGIKIDSVDFDQEFVLGQTVKNQRGFETYVGIKRLSEGKHILNITKKRIKKTDTTNYINAQIPFWYYPD